MNHRSVVVVRVPPCRFLVGSIIMVMAVRQLLPVLVRTKHVVVVVVERNPMFSPTFFACVCSFSLQARVENNALALSSEAEVSRRLAVAATTIQTKPLLPQLRPMMTISTLTMMWPVK